MLPTTTQQPASTTSTSSSSRGSMTSSVPGQAVGTSGRAALRPETQETHNNQSAVDATTPLYQMILGDGGGGRGAPAMAPGHPGAVGMWVGDTWEHGEARKRQVSKGGPLPTNRLKGFSCFLSLHQVERFGDRNVSKEERAAHVGAPYNREETGAGRERQRRDTGRGILAEGHRRRGGRQYEWDVRFARAMPGGPQARWAPSRRDVRASLPSPQCFFGSRTRSKQQSNNISKG